MSKPLTENEPEVKVDRSIIQKGVLDSALALLGQIDIDDVSDVNLTTSNLCGCFEVNLNVEFKAADE